MDIWAKWAEHYKVMGVDLARISKDGIFDETKYGAAKKKILFVLRETNDFPEGDLRKLLKDGPRWQLWFTVSRWAAGILKDFPPYAEVDNEAVITEAFFQIAAINLKKATGGSTADLVVVNAFAYRDCALLLEQIKGIEPDIIVACGTFDALMWILDMDVNPDKPHAAIVRDRTTGALVVPIRHPGRINKTNKKLYDDLRELFRDVRRVPAV